MKISFACPACGATGSGDEALIGRQVRCKPCQHRFVIAGPDDDAGYLLDRPAGGGATAPETGPVFVAARGGEPSAFVSPRKPKVITPGPRARPSGRDPSGFEWGTWLIRGGIVVAVGLVAIAAFAPRGPVIVGSTLALLGTAMVLVGFAAGAYGAFSEDVLYGLLYLAIPLYTAYYLVTRWEDLWKWSVCSTVGVAFVFLGTEMLRRAGVGE